MLFDFGQPIHTQLESRDIGCVAAATRVSLAAAGCADGSVVLIDLLRCEIVTFLRSPVETDINATSGLVLPTDASGSGPSSDAAATAAPGERNMILATLHPPRQNRGTGEWYIGCPSEPFNVHAKQFFHSGRPVTAVSFSEDANVVATTGEDGSVYLFDIHTITRGIVARSTGIGGPRGSDWGHVPEVRWRRLEGHQGSPVTTCCFAPSMTLLATAAHDGDVMLWGSKGLPVCPRLRFHTNWVAAVAFSEDSEYVASAGYDHYVCVWCAQMFRLLGAFKVHQSPVLCVAFSLENTIIGSGDSEGNIILTRAADGVVLRSICGHFKEVTGIRFAEPLGVFLTTSHDSSLRVWSLKGECLSTVKTQRNRVLSLAVSLHDDVLITTGDDFLITFLPLILKSDRQKGPR